MFPTAFVWAWKFNTNIVFDPFDGFEKFQVLGETHVSMVCVIICVNNQSAQYKYAYR